MSKFLLGGNFVKNNINLKIPILLYQLLVILIEHILISYGNEDQLAIEKQLAELNAQAINRL